MNDVGAAEHTGGSTRDDILGVVLAGGKSRRMQTDKAMLVGRSGLPLTLQAAVTLGGVVNRVAISGRSDRWVRERLRAARDEATAAPIPSCFALPDPPAFEGYGPLAGLLAAMEAANRLHCESILVMPVDMPDILPQSLRLLIAPRDAVATVAKTDRVQPLVARYATDLASGLKDALKQQQRSVHRWLASVEHVEVDLGDRVGINLNHPHEYEHWHRS